MPALRRQNFECQRYRGRLLYRGFTLVELIVVITIIVLLVAFLLPAVFSGIARARISEVKSEIIRLESAIAAFQAKYGMDPPSRITLYPNQAGWDSDPRSRGFIRRMWPQFDFSGSGGLPVVDRPGQIDIPAVGLTLNGAECLVFFLGGIIDPDSGAHDGFSKNPRTPFISGGNRVEPFFEFDGGLDTNTVEWKRRLADVSVPPNDAPEYRDTFPGQALPYIYFSSYDGRGYSVAGTPWQNVDCAGLMNYAYYTSFNAANATNSQPYRPNGFQIISPGMDFQYGTGRLFDPENTIDLSVADADNITNFHDGCLKR